MSTNKRAHEHEISIDKSDKSQGRWISSEFACSLINEKNERLLEVQFLTRRKNNYMFVFAFPFNLSVLLSEILLYRVKCRLACSLQFATIQPWRRLDSHYDLFSGNWTPAIWFLLWLVVAWSDALLYVNIQGLRQKLWIYCDLSFSWRYCL